MACLECRRRRIRCDNAKPSCQHCTRLSKNCEYALHEQRRGPKKKSVKQLEERLASLEAQLKAEKTSGSSEGSPAQDPNFDTTHLISSNATTSNAVSPNVMNDSMTWNMTNEVEMNDANMDVQLNLIARDWPGSTATALPPQSFEQCASLPDKDSGNDTFPDLHEIQELNRLFSDNVYPCIPIVRTAKFDPTQVRMPEEHPPLCLQYAMWALAAVRSSKYVSRAAEFYRNAKMHLEHDESQGDGQGSATVEHVQTLALIATYESESASSGRAFLSYCRAISLSSLLGLHQMDDESGSTEQSYYVLDPPKDHIEMEERRRTFWYLYYCDKWAATSPGRTSDIKEQEITTCLPASEEAFRHGYVDKNQSLKDAIKNGINSTASPLTASVLSARILEKCTLHLRQVSKITNAADELDFWLHHLQIDNELSTFLLNLPDHLTFSQTKDPLMLFVNMCICSLIISLFQAAAVVAECSTSKREELPRFRARAHQSAVDIMDMMHSASSIGIIKLYSFTPFLLYKAFTVLLNEVTQSPENDYAKEQLRFIFNTAKIFRKYWKSEQQVVAQILHDLKVHNVDAGIEAEPEDAIPVMQWSQKHVDFDGMGSFFSVANLQRPAVPD